MGGGRGGGKGRGEGGAVVGRICFNQSSFIFNIFVSLETKNLSFDAFLVLHTHFRFSCRIGVDGAS